MNTQEETTTVNMRSPVHTQTDASPLPSTDEVLWVDDIIDVEIQVSNRVVRITDEDIIPHKILVLDNDAEANEQYRALLGRRPDVDLVIVNCAENAMKVIRSGLFVPDIIIAENDLGPYLMMEGMEFLDWAQARVPDVDVLVVAKGMWALVAADNRQFKTLAKPAMDSDIIEALGLK